MAVTVQDGPVTHAGTKATPVFSYTRSYPHGSDGPERPFGRIVVPEAIRLDICRFHDWMEDSLILRWAQLTVEMNPHTTVAEVLPYLVYSPYQERDTREVRALLEQRDGESACVWSGKRLSRQYAVDHVIPFSVWGNNDWWNLLPTDARVNGQKSDALPARALLLERREAIAGYWRLYFARVPERFGQHVEPAQKGETAIFLASPLVCTDGGASLIERQGAFSEHTAILAAEANAPWKGAGMSELEERLFWVLFLALLLKLLSLNL